MKIIQVISQLGNGGAEKLVVELCNEMSKEHEVILVSFKDVENWMIFPKMLSNNVKLISFHKKKGISLKLFICLTKLLLVEKPDILNFHLDSTLKYIIPFIIFFRKIIFVNTIHNNLHNGKYKKYLFLYKYVLWAKSIKFVCISEDIIKEYVEAFPKFNFNFIANGIKPMEITSKFLSVEKEIENYYLDGYTDIFLAVGRVNIQKNYPMLMDVFSERRKIMCLIIGEDTDPYKNLQGELNKKITNNVKFLGLKDNVADYMYKSKALIMSSLFEGLPIVAIEALSVGLPIVCTPAGGLVDLVEQGANGFIADGFEKDDLQKQIDNFLNASHKQIEDIMQNNQRKYKEKYSIRRCADKYLSLYQNKKNIF